MEKCADGRNMTIKEVEKLLGIPRANIRFYEKEGFISPDRKENEYRDYSESDVETLRKVVIFRKLGMSLDEIRDLMDGSSTLSDAIERNTQSIKDKVEELNGVLEVCSEIRRDSNLDFSSFDTDKYWTQIFDKEQAGKRFFDISKDFIDYQKGFMLQYLGNLDGENAKAISTVDRDFQGGSPTIAILRTLLFVLVPVGFLWSFGLTGILVGLCIGFVELALMGLIMWATHKYSLAHPEAKKAIIITRHASLILVIVLMINILMSTLQKFAENAGGISAIETNIKTSAEIVWIVLYTVISITFIIWGIRLLTNKTRPRFSRAALHTLLIFLLILFTGLTTAMLKIQLENGLVGIFSLIACASYLFNCASNMIMLIKEA